MSEIERVFKAQDNPMLGPTYILPNGKFLNIPTPKQMGVGALFSYKCHSLIYAYLVSKQLVKGTIWEINDMHYLEDKGCIRVNLGDIPDEDALLNYIQLGKKKPNYDQQDAIIKWLDFAQQNNIKQVELQAGPWGTTKSYSFDEYLSDDILNRVMRYYSSGRLYEDKI